MATEPTIEFKEKGFPVVQIFESHFAIKSKFSGQFKIFYFKDVKKIQHQNPRSQGFQFGFTITRLLFAKTDPWILKITKNNDSIWTYSTTYKRNFEFKKLIHILNKALALWYSSEGVSEEIKPYLLAWKNKNN